MIITCDTNFYRELVSELPLSNLKKVDKVINMLLEAEKQKGIKALIGPIAAQEVLSHLLDHPRSRAYKACLKASRVLYRHCEEDSQQFRLLPTPEVQFSMEYFHFNDQSAIDTLQTIGVVFSELAKNTSRKTIEKYNIQLTQNKQFIQTAENELINGVEQLCKQIDSNYTKWNLFANNPKQKQKWLNHVRSPQFKDQTAEAFLTAVYLRIQTFGCPSYTQQQIQQMVPTFVTSCQVGLSLRQFFWEQFVQPDFDLTKKSRANFLWDEQILYYVGRQINNDTIMLVTSDKQMKRAAERCGMGNVVMGYEEYLDYLGIRDKVEKLKKNPIRDFFRKTILFFRKLKNHN